MHLPPESPLPANISGPQVLEQDGIDRRVEGLDPGVAVEPGTGEAGLEIAIDELRRHAVAE